MSSSLPASLELPLRRVEDEASQRIERIIRIFVYLFASFAPIRILALCYKRGNKFSPFLKLIFESENQI